MEAFKNPLRYRRDRGHFVIRLTVREAFECAGVTSSIGNRMRCGRIRGSTSVQEIVKTNFFKDQMCLTSLIDDADVIAVDASQTRIPRSGTLI